MLHQELCQYRSFPWSCINSRIELPEICTPWRRFLMPAFQSCIFCHSNHCRIWWSAHFALSLDSCVGVPLERFLLASPHQTLKSYSGHFLVSSLSVTGDDFASSSSPALNPTQFITTHSIHGGLRGLAPCNKVSHNGHNLWNTMSKLLFRLNWE